jgi:hypothetical protein
MPHSHSLAHHSTLIRAEQSASHKGMDSHSQGSHTFKLRQVVHAVCHCRISMHTRTGSTPQFRTSFIISRLSFLVY